jgi:hypothetical protein
MMKTSTDERYDVLGMNIFRSSAVGARLMFQLLHHGDHVSHGVAC